MISGLIPFIGQQHYFHIFQTEIIFFENELGYEIIYGC